MSGISGDVIKELLVFRSALCYGALCALFYDLIRLGRRIIPKGVALVSIQDIFFWALVSLGFFLLVYEENNGCLRGYIFGGIALGAFLYWLLLGRFLMEVGQRFIRWAKKRLKKHENDDTIGKKEQ